MAVRHSPGAPKINVKQPMFSNVIVATFIDMFEDLVNPFQWSIRGKANFARMANVEPNLCTLLKTEPTSRALSRYT